MHEHIQLREGFSTENVGLLEKVSRDGCLKIVFEAPYVKVSI